MPSFALGIKRDLVASIRNGAKRQTIRPHRRDGRTPVPGDFVSFYVGMRTSDCRLVKRVEVAEAFDIEISTHNVRVDGRYANADIIATLDGFKNVRELRRFLFEIYRVPAAGISFRGFGVRW